MSTPRVLCLGEILFDYLADQVDCDLTEVESWTAYAGGAPANVACGLVKLGTPAGFIGAVGQDAAGEQLVGLLTEIGVDITGVQRPSAVPTRKVYVTRSQTGERQFAGFGETLTTEFADTRLDSELLPESLFTKAEYLVLGTVALAYPDSLEAVHRAMELAYHNDIQTIVDLNWRPLFWLEEEMATDLIWEVINQADYVKCTKQEAEWLFQTSDPLEIYEKLDTAEGVLVTDGAAGCRYCLGDWDGEVAGFQVAAKDSTGAGDGFLAGFVHQLCRLGDDLLDDETAAQNAVRYANAVGALTTMQPGAIAALPNAEAVKAFWSRQTRRGTR
jgi:fructokinase